MPTEWQLHVVVGGEKKARSNTGEKCLERLSGPDGGLPRHVHFVEQEKTMEQENLPSYAITETFFGSSFFL